jgi:hypothetical protein
VQTGPLTFLQNVQTAKQHLAEALQAAQQQSGFQQLGATPQMPQQQDPMQAMLMQAMAAQQGGMGQPGMMPPQQPMMPPQQPMMPQGMPQQPVQQFSKGGGAWTRKEGQSPEGGLNAVGRASLKAQGQDIKSPVSAKQAKKSPKAAARRKSFCARTSGMDGPMKDDNGKPTRKALALRKWDC